MKNTAKKIQPVKKTKRSFIDLAPKDLQLAQGGKGGIEGAPLY